LRSSGAYGANADCDEELDEELFDMNPEEVLEALKRK